MKLSDTTYTDCTKPDCKKQGEDRYDPYGIYAWRMCAEHWQKSGIRTWEFDPDFAGEALDEDDY